MSEVTRYNFELYHCNGGDMEIAEYGDYVSHEDYAALQQKLDALAAEREKFAVECAAAKIAIQYANNAGFKCLLNTPDVDAYLNSVRADAIRQVSHEAQGYEEQFKRPLTNAEWSTLVGNYWATFDGLSQVSAGEAK